MNADISLVEAVGVKRKMWVRCLSPRGTRWSDRELIREPGRRVGCGLWEFHGATGVIQLGVIVAKSSSRSNLAPLGLRTVDSEQPRLSSQMHSLREESNCSKSKIWGKGVYGSWAKDPKALLESCAEVKQERKSGQAHPSLWTSSLLLFYKSFYFTNISKICHVWGPDQTKNSDALGDSPHTSSLRVISGMTRDAAQSLVLLLSLKFK